MSLCAPCAIGVPNLLAQANMIRDHGQPGRLKRGGAVVDQAHLHCCA